MGVGIVGVTFKLLGVWSIPIDPPPIESETISIPPPLWGGFYLASISSRLGMILVPFWECLSSHGVMNQKLRLLGLKTPLLHKLVKRYLILIPPPGVVQKQEIQISMQSHFCAGSLEDSESTTSVHMSYQCFSSTISSMLPKNFNCSVII